VLGDTNNSEDVFVHDRQLGLPSVRASTTAAARPAIKHVSRYQRRWPLRLLHVLGQLGAADTDICAGYPVPQAALISTCTTARRERPALSVGTVSVGHRQLARTDAMWPSTPPHSPSNFTLAFVHDRSTGLTPWWARAMKPQIHPGGPIRCLRIRIQLGAGDTNERADVYVARSTNKRRSSWSMDGMEASRTGVSSSLGLRKMDTRFSCSSTMF